VNVALVGRLAVFWEAAIGFCGTGNDQCAGRANVEEEDGELTYPNVVG
jgi:hypothetical protein